MQLAKSTLFFCRLLFPVNVILTSQFLTLRTRFSEFLPKWRGVFPIKRQSWTRQSEEALFEIPVVGTYIFLCGWNYIFSKKRFYQRLGEYFRPLLANSRAKNIASISRSCCHILEMFKCMCHSLLFSGTIPPPRVECKDIAPNEKVGCLVPENTNMTTCLFLGCCWNDTEADSAKKCYTRR